MESLPLKDIHLPADVSWWPPAAGWWLVAILLPPILVGLAYLYKRLRWQTALKTAGKVLKAIRQDHARDSLQRLAELSVLLRRVAISVSPRSEAASLTGDGWLAYLDASMQNEDAPFSRGVGRCLADAHYRRVAPADTDLEALFQLCERWLKRQRTNTFLPRKKNRMREQ